MSFTRGTLVSCKPQNAATFSIFDVIMLAKSLPRRCAHTTYALLKRLDIIVADTDATGSSQVPACLSRQVLDHDAAQDDELGVDAVEDAVVRQVEAIGDLDGDPCYELMSIHVRTTSQW